MGSIAYHTGDKSRRSPMRRGFAAVLVSLAILPLGAAAQATPSSRPLTIVVPYTPGTGADVIARLLAPRLAERLKMPVVVDNRPGASSAIGTELVAKAPADGHTLLFTATSHGTLPALKRNLPYDAVKSFTPVALAATSALSIVVSPQVNASSLAEFLALARKQPGVLHYSSPGSGSPQHLTMELIKLETGIDVVHVPYKGSAGPAPPPLGGDGHGADPALPTTAAVAASGRARRPAARTLAEHGVIDAYGHASARSEANAERFLMPRNVAPELVTEDDILEFGLDSEPIGGRGEAVYHERFIHGEIYKARPDVMAIVHNHSHAVVPFSCTGCELKPIFHMSAFIGLGVPTWDIRDAQEGTDMLVRTRELGAHLAQALERFPAVLMRGHGSTVVAENPPRAVGRTIYLDANARMQYQAMALAGPGGYVNYMDEREVAANVSWQNYERAWRLWTERVLAKLENREVMSGIP